MLAANTQIANSWAGLLYQSVVIAQLAPAQSCTGERNLSSVCLLHPYAMLARAGILACCMLTEMLPGVNT